MSVATASPYRHAYTIGMLLQGGPSFHLPVDVGVSDDGRLYVANRANMYWAGAQLRVTICTVDEEYLGEFGKFGTDDGQLTWPTAVTVDRHGQVYIADEYRHDVQVFDRDGGFLRKWGAFGAGDGQLNRPSGLAVDPDGNILVSDTLNHRVQRFTPDGEFLAKWGEAGSGPRQVDHPWGLAADAAGQVYVADWGNHRVQKYTADGCYLASFGSLGSGEGQFKRPSSVSLDGDGRLYVCDWANDRVQVLTPDGRYLATMVGDGGISKWAAHWLEVNPDKAEERQIHAENVLAGERHFRRPMAVKVDREGRVLVVDTSRHRIQVYRPA